MRAFQAARSPRALLPATPAADRLARCISAAHAKKVRSGRRFVRVLRTLSFAARIGALPANKLARDTLVTSAPPFCRWVCCTSERKPAAQHLVASGRAGEAVR
eukprot:11209852-Lingulodinium_polyedra.AAC.1